MNKKVGVIILNWNGENLLREFLPSVVQNTNQELADVIVVDNASTDDSWRILEEEFSETMRLRLDKNHGYAGGYNRAIEQMDYPYVVLLNSDVEVTKNWLGPLVAALDNDKDLAAIQPKIRAYREKHKFEYAGACGGFIDYLGFPFCMGRILNEVEIDKGQYDKEKEIFWASGAAMVIKRELYLKAGGLDERFFAHMEEIDLCWRLKNLGYHIKVVPQSIVYHLGGGTLPMNHPNKLFLNYRNNLLMLYKNLDKKSFSKILFKRKLLDCMAITMFLLKGEFSNMKSVLKAYKEFDKLKDLYPKPIDTKQFNEVYNRSIVLDYYLHRKKKYSQLNF